MNNIESSSQLSEAALYSSEIGFDILKNELSKA